VARKKKENLSVDTKKESVSDLEERAINLVRTCKKESVDFYEEKFKNFNFYDRLYIRGSAKTNVPYGRANLELPLAFQQVEAFTSNMTETMVGETPYISYVGRQKEDDQAAEQITDFSQYQLECGDFLTAWMSWIRNVGKYGTGVMKLNWEKEVVEIEHESDVPAVSLDPETGQLVQGFKTVVDIEMYEKHDGPRFYNISLFDFFIPKGVSGPNTQKMPWVIHRTYRTLEQLLDNPNYTRNRSWIKQLIKERNDESNPLNSSSTIHDEAKRTEVNQKNPSKGNEKYSGQVEVLEYWGDFNFTPNGPQVPSLIVVANIEDERMALRIDQNPLKFKFKPFIMANDYPIEGEAYGYGEIHHIKGLIQESSALRNARLDVANISLNRVWLVERQAGVNLRELYTAPNKVILTNDLGGIKPMDMGQVTASSVQELARIDFDIQNTTEIINPRQDVSNVGAAFGSTATGVNFLAGKANIRLLTKARLLQETFFKPLADMLNWFNRDLITDEAFYRVAGDGGSNPYRTISPDAFLTRVDFKPSSSPDKLTLSQRRDNMAYLLQTLAQIEKVSPGTNNWPELLKDIHKLAGHPHPDKYILQRPTQIFQTPQGQTLDDKGQPVQVVAVDEQGNPIQAGDQPPTQ